jgi:hypothetical protein
MRLNFWFSCFLILSCFFLLVSTKVVVNAQEYDWCYTLDFESSAYDVIPYVSSAGAIWGNWVTGTGWRSVYGNAGGGSYSNRLHAYLDFEVASTVQFVELYGKLYDGYTQVFAAGYEATWLELWNDSTLDIRTSRTYSQFTNDTLNDVYLSFTGINLTANQVRFFMRPDDDTDSVNDVAYVYTLVIRGDGVEPFPSLSNECSTITSTPTITPTVDPDAIVQSNNLCPSGANVNSSSVSGDYIKQCNHCLFYEFPTSVYSSPTPDETQVANMTLTPQPTSSYPTKTPIYTVDDMTPIPATSMPDATSTPVPAAQSFTFDGEPLPDWIDLKYGDLPADSVDLLINGYWNRIVSIQIKTPRNDSGLPYHLDSIYLDYDITSPTYAGLNAYYVARGSGGQELASSWFNVISSGNGGVTLRPQTEVGGSYISMSGDGVYFVEIAIVSSRDLDEMNLDGSLSFNYVNVAYQESWVSGSSSGSWFGSDVVCYRPQDYPANDLTMDEMLNVSLFSVANTPTCYTLFPYIDMNGFMSVVPGVDLTSDYYIPRIDMCVYWVTLGEVIMLGIVIPFDLIISIGSVFLLIRMLRTM